MGKKILLTGASSGIGRAIGHYLTEKGHHIIGTSRTPKPDNQPFEVLQLDVTSAASVQQACDAAVERFGKIDVLINNAGFGISGAVEDTPEEEAWNQLDTNYFGTVRMTTTLLPHFRANRDGLIINMSSLGGLLGLPFQAHYSASKFALEGFTEALRMEVAPFNIRVCNINPGDFKTGFTANRRIVAGQQNHYTAKFNQFLAMYERDENAGSDPIQIAKLVESLLYRPNVRIRYTAGKPQQTMAVALKRLLGEALFEKMLRSMWKV